MKHQRKEAAREAITHGSAKLKRSRNGCNTSNISNAYLDTTSILAFLVAASVCCVHFLCRPRQLRQKVQCVDMKTRLKLL